MVKAYALPGVAIERTDLLLTAAAFVFVAAVLLFGLYP